ncbi:MAG: AEC family transporter [Treponema sp.]|nr:AEC family transporter [Treponema sp.]
MYLLVLKQLAIMALIVVGGFIFAKITKAGQTEQKFLSKLLLYFVNPCLVISSFNLDFDAVKLRQFGFVAFISLIIHGVMICVALLCTLRRKHENGAHGDLVSIDRVATVFTNCGFVGIPLIRGVFGDEGVFYLMGYLVIFNVFLWTYGYYQMCGTVNLKKIITNPNIIAVILGIIIFCMPFKLPFFIIKPISMIGDLNTATSMILIGILFADFKLPKDSTGKAWAMQLTWVTVCRLVICVAVNILVLFAASKIFANMADIRMMLFVILICSACPSATSVPSLSVLFNKNVSYASLVVSISSLFCIFTVPTFVAIAEMIM